jgi:hypothetical protein
LAAAARRRPLADGVARSREDLAVLVEAAARFATPQPAASLPADVG